MTTTAVWSIELFLTEDPDRSRADAVLRLGDRQFRGFGRARRNPSDPDVPRIGEEVAAARALVDLSQHLLHAAAEAIEAFEGHEVELPALSGPGRASAAPSAPLETRQHVRGTYFDEVGNRRPTSTGPVLSGGAVLSGGDSGREHEIPRDIDAVVRTVEKTRDWIAAVIDATGGKDEQRAWLCLRAVLHALRDRLPLETLGHVSAQLPLLIRGVLFEGWDPTGKPEKLGMEAFVARVQHEALLTSPAEAEVAIRAVANVLWDHLAEGLMTHVVETLPTEFNRLLSS